MKLILSLLSFHIDSLTPNIQRVNSTSNADDEFTGYIGDFYEEDDFTKLSERSTTQHRVIPQR